MMTEDAVPTLKVPRQRRHQNIAAAIAAVLHGQPLGPKIVRAAETIITSLERDGDAAGAALVRTELAARATGPGFQSLHAQKHDALDWPKPPTEKLVLDAGQQATFDRLLRELAAVQHFVAVGVDPPARILFVGATGTGKTLAARTIADRLGLPIGVARLDRINDSHLGESAKKLRTMFEAAAETPCVLLLDEVDGLTERRGRISEASSAASEMERTTLAVFQQLDALPATQIVVAATNITDRLDPALVRRFPMRLEFGAPNEEARARMVRGWLARVKAAESDVEALIASTAGLGGADVRAAVMTLGRRLVLEQYEAGLDVTTGHDPF